MISRVKIEAASDVLEDVAIESLISIVRTTARYMQNPAYFTDLRTKLIAVDGTLQAQQVNAALDELELLGVGEVELNQSQTVGTDGLIYSKTRERQALVAYMLGILYEAYQPTIYVDISDTDSLLTGNYSVGRLPQEYEGYL